LGTSHHEKLARSFVVSYWYTEPKVLKLNQYVVHFIDFFPFLFFFFNISLYFLYESLFLKKILF